MMDDHARMEALGSLVLADDGDALDFGQQVIRELLDENARRDDGWKMDITGERRAIASPLVDPTGTTKIKKPLLTSVAVR
jgi:hypothetical protein